MSNEPIKPAASPTDIDETEQAGTTEKPAGDAVKQESEQDEPTAEEAAAQLGDFA